MLASFTIADTLPVPSIENATVSLSKNSYCVISAVRSIYCFVPSISVKIICCVSALYEKFTAIFSICVSIVIFEPFFLVIVIIPVFSSNVTSCTSVEISSLVAFVVSSVITLLSISSVATSILFRLLSFSGVSSLG